MRKRVVVIGGGISGLSAAHRLAELGREKDLDLEVILLESAGSAGGVISTIQKEGFLIEEGPDSFITTKPWALDLCNRLGLTQELIETERGKRRSFVLLNKELVPIPEGFQMLAPGSAISFLKTPLFSWRGKARMLMDLVLPRKRIRDESLASFVRRRLGREALEHAAQPMISGVYMADPETLSLTATMPRFIEMEEKYGSIIKGIYRSQRENSAQSKDGGARYSLFLSFKNGMRTLVDALLEALPRDSVILNQKVERVERTEKGWEVKTKDSAFTASGVVIATPSYKTGELLESVDSSLAEELKRIEYASSAVITSAHRREDIALHLDGFGFVVPSVENCRLLACSFSSIKFKGRAPEGTVLLRSFSGGALDPGVLELGDREIAHIAEKELGVVLGIGSAPLFSIVKRYARAMPQYNLGHLDLVARINEKVNKLEGLQIAGSAYEGVGIPDCVHSGEKAAHAIIKILLNS